MKLKKILPSVLIVTLSALYFVYPAYKEKVMSLENIIFSGMPDTPAMTGDVNDDGKTDAYDVDIIQKYLVKKCGLANSDTADCNQDKRIDVFDVIAVKRKVLNINRQPVSTAITTFVTETVPVSTIASTITAAVTTTTPAVTTTATVTTTAVTAANEEEKINAYINKVAELVNKERAAYGIAPVEINPVLVDAAMLRAEEISRYFSHTRPDGTSCFTIFDDLNLKCSYCSENIAAGSSAPEATMKQWINSEGHYNNLMSPKVSEIGIGYYYAPGTPYKYYWVQLFRKP